MDLLDVYKAEHIGSINMDSLLDSALGKHIDETRKYGIVDLGKLLWSYTSPTAPQTVGYFSAEANLKVNDVSQWATQKGVCSKGYEPYAMFYLTNNEYRLDKKIAWYPTILRITDSDYTDADTFKSAMSGQYLKYEKIEG